MREICGSWRLGNRNHCRAWHRIHKLGERSHWDQFSPDYLSLSLGLVLRNSRVECLWSDYYFSNCSLIVIAGSGPAVLVCPSVGGD